MSMNGLYLELENKILAMTGGTGSTIFNHTMVWNNQLNHLINSDDYSFGLPAVLIEMGTENYGDLGQNYMAVDMILKYHIIQDFYNGPNMSENLTIFALRDAVIKEFNAYQPTGGGFMSTNNEYQDYDHTNLYHYVIEYVFHFIDDTAVLPIYYGTATTLTINTDIIP